MSSSSSSIPGGLKVYQFFMFCFPIFFIFVLLFLFYFFYLRPPRLNCFSLPMPSSSTLHNFHHNIPTLQSGGLNKDFREMLPVIVYKESFCVPDPLCSVCLGGYEAYDRLQQIPACGHTFHIDCIDHWLSTHTTCPLCRLSLLSSAKSPTKSSNTQVGNTQGPSVAENDGETSLRQSSQPCEQLAQLTVRDTSVPHNGTEENIGRSHCVDCEREQLECKGQAINA